MSCPKCSGDLREELTIYDSYVSCVKCRYTLTHPEKRALLVSAESFAPPVVHEEEPQHETLPPGAATKTG
jgi:hypothetical protein